VCGIIYQIIQKIIQHSIGQEARVSQAKRQTRKERALAAQRERERKQRLRFGGIVFVAIAVLGFFFWLGNRPTAVDVAAPTGADRTAWGRADAPVVIEEWSDFN
jgi:hypothetical protein